jgi:hypothetical protein
MTTEKPETRTAYIDGLRTLASVLELHPDLPLPYEGNDSPFTIHFLHGADPRGAMAAAARMIPCKWAKTSDDNYFDLRGELAGLKIKLTAFRDAVCTRIVTGTREVTEEVTDPDAPKVTVTHIIEDVEWDCGPLLAGSEPAAKTATP